LPGLKRELNAAQKTMTDTVYADLWFDY